MKEIRWNKALLLAFKLRDKAKKGSLVCIWPTCMYRRSMAAKCRKWFKFLLMWTWSIASGNIVYILFPIGPRLCIISWNYCPGIPASSYTIYSRNLMAFSEVSIQAESRLYMTACFLIWNWSLSLRGGPAPSLLPSTETNIENSILTDVLTSEVTRCRFFWRVP